VTSHIAIHEAGHALIAWYYGFSLHRVTVTLLPSSGEYMGACHFSRGRVDLLDAPLTLGAFDVYIKFAGRIATELYYNGATGGYDKDFKDVAAMVPKDRETLKMHSFDFDKGSIEGFYRRFSGSVRRVLKSKKAERALMALADELDKSGTLSGAAAAVIFENSWGKPLPKKARPVDDHMSVLNNAPTSHQGLLQELTSLARLMSRDIESMKWQLDESIWASLHHTRLYLNFLNLEIERVKGQHP